MPDIALLNPVVLNGVIEKFLVPENLIGLSQIMAGQTEPSADPTVVYDIIQASREIAKPNVPNAEAHVIKQLGVGQVSSSMIYLRDKKAFKATTLRWLRAPGQIAASNATAAVLRELQDLANRFDKFKEFCIWQMFVTGTLQFTGGGVTINIDYQVPSSHKPTAGTLWTNPAADIIGDVRAWRRLVSRDGQAVLTRAILNDVTMGYLNKNTDIKTFFLNFDKRNEVLTTGQLTGLVQMTWQVYDLGYVDDNGVVQQYIPDSKVVMISEENNDRWFLYQGPSADTAAPEGHIGRFSKTWEQEDPSGRQYLLEEMFLPALFRPEQIICATVG